ncbi:MAG: nucleotidyl transferase AbiEii/AbiGii toxin family protein [Bacteroidetes bacterium]|nr:nucleotidyl transferase AbiEii/AbiGii toxin family protein [Bacteroidota bacterium]MCL5737638.1 nucleotidyl transferase AbiEii/AbiGii toxin family protein [Bacteroidota bacterium]
MKEYIAELIRGVSTPLQARNIVREYLQARILGAMQRAGAMIPLSFHGGTALRFLFSTGRYSEDLDFTLEKNRDDYDFHKYLESIKSELTAEGYNVGLKVSEKKIVHGAFVNLRSLLYELGLSPHRDETIAVKIEVDTNPPKGAILATTVVRRYVTLQLQHHDKASFLSGKLHAILQRSHLKGRDLYDLLWYLSDPNWHSPNFVLLNNALQQTEWPGPELTDGNWRRLVREKIDTINWQNVVDDVRPFLDTTADAGLLTKENLDRLLV